MSKNLQPAKPKPFLGPDDEARGLLRTKLPHLPMEEGNPWKNPWLVTTIRSTGAIIEGLEHGLDSWTTRKQRFQRSIGCNQSPNEDATFSTLY
jgi:hypothetical protein